MSVVILAVIFVVFEKVPSTTRRARQFFSQTAQHQVASTPLEPPPEEPSLRSVNRTISLKYLYRVVQKSDNPVLILR